MKNLLLPGLPIVLLLLATAAGGYLGMQQVAFPSGPEVQLHHALSNLPEKMAEFSNERLERLKSIDGYDPFLRPPKGAAAAEVTAQQSAGELIPYEELHLSSIATGSTGRFCIINGKMFFEGHTTPNFTISRITAEAIEVRTRALVFALHPGQKAAIDSGGKLIPLEPGNDTNPSEQQRTDERSPQ